MGVGARDMTQSERSFIISCWLGACTIVSIWYLSGNFLIGFFAGLFVGISVGLGLAVRHLSRLAITLPIIAFTVAVAAPFLAKLPDLVDAIPTFLAYIKAMIRQAAG